MYPARAKDLLQPSANTSDYYGSYDAVGPTSQGLECSALSSAQSTRLPKRVQIRIVAQSHSRIETGRVSGPVIIFVSRQREFQLLLN
jgi:hypothetical protein